MALEKEIETYRKRLTELVAHEGKFVVIQGEEIAGFWDTYEDALQAGYGKYGLTPFLVKQVSSFEQVQLFSRDLSLCRS